MFVFLTACSTEEIGESLEAVSFNSKIFSSVKLFIKQPEKFKLSQEDIDSICDSLHIYPSNCTDGSQIIKCSFNSENIIYIRYFPKRLPNGNYKFFENISPLKEIDYREDNLVVIPMSINNSKSARFLANVKYSIRKDNIHVKNITFTFFHKKDKEFNKMYAPLNYNEQEAYRLSRVPNKNLKGKKLSEFLQACVHNGNMYVLEELYKLLPEDDLENKFKIELASFLSSKSTIPFSDENPYKPEVFYSENYKNFPQINTLNIILESLQTNNSLEEFGAQKIEPNFNWEGVYQIPNLHDYYEYVEEYEQTLAVYKLDMDNDGLMEILAVFPGGSMGNLLWEVMHLDESGNITSISSGESADGLSLPLYYFQGNYFFLTNIIDFYDKEFLGWKVYALDQNSVMYRADVWFEKTGSEVIFADEYTKKNIFNYIDLDTYIDTYKRYEHKAIGTEIKADKEILALFKNKSSPSYIYGVFDFNNDNIDDWTNAYMVLPSNRHMYYCNYIFVDGKSKQSLDFADLIDKRGSFLRCMIPCEQEDKNYFICVLNWPGNYILKLIEIKGVQVIELKSWFVSVTKRILVEVSKHKGEGIGL